jgi:flagellin
MTMISINTNYGGIFAAKASSQSQATIDQAMERLSTGKRINNARDDSAGLAIATRLTAQVEGLSIASRNAADAQSMLDTAEGALQEVHNVLLRMRELAVQSANGTLTDNDRVHTDAEFQQLEAEITRISDNTKWAGQALIDGSVDGFAGTAAVAADASATPPVAAVAAVPARPALSFQVGEGSGQTITVSINGMDATDLSLNTNTVSTASSAQTAITALDAAIATVSTERGKLGAYSNRLTSTMNNLDQVSINLSASKGRIEDADFAAETGNLAKGQILQQAATAMLAQANASKSSILTLVRG